MNPKLAIPERLSLSTAAGDQPHASTTGMGRITAGVGRFLRERVPLLGDLLKDGPDTVAAKYVSRREPYLWRKTAS